MKDIGVSNQLRGFSFRRGLSVVFVQATVLWGWIFSFRVVFCLQAQPVVPPLPLRRLLHFGAGSSAIGGTSSSSLGSECVQAIRIESIIESLLG